MHKKKIDMRKEEKKGKYSFNIINITNTNHIIIVCNIIFFPKNII